MYAVSLNDSDPDSLQSYHRPSTPELITALDGVAVPCGCRVKRSYSVYVYGKSPSNADLARVSEALREAWLGVNDDAELVEDDVEVQVQAESDRVSRELRRPHNTTTEDPKGWARTHNTTLLCKAKRQYLLTCKVSRYCLSALHGNTALMSTTVIFIASV